MKLSPLSIPKLPGLILLTTPIVALAAETEEGNSDIFAGGLFTSIFNILLFLLVLAVLSKWAWQPLLNSLKKREEFIKRSLDDAQQAQEKADRSLKSYESKLKLAEEEAQRIIDQSKTEAQKAAEEIVAAAKSQADECMRQAQTELQHAREMALKDIFQEMAGLVSDVAGRVIQKNLDMTDQQKLIQDALDKYECDGPRY